MIKPKLRRLTSLLLTLSLFLILLPPTSASVVNSLGFSEGVTGAPGENVSIAVNIAGGTQIGSAEFKVAYDNTKLQIVSVTPGTLTANLTNQPNAAYSDHEAYFMFASTGTVVGTGQVAILNFKVLSSAALGATNLTFEGVLIGDANSKDVSNTFQINGGTISISNSYTTTFDPAGGSAVSDVTVTKGNSIASAPATTKKGYTLNGWYDSSNQKVAFPYTPAGNAALHAVWDMIPITLADRALADGTCKGAYSDTIAAAGGSGSFTYAISSGSLPAGLTMSDSGVISGTPTQNGSYSITVKATDKVNGAIASATFTLKVSYVGAVAAPAASIADGSYEKGEVVSLSTATSGAIIYYTTDLSDPTVSSIVYTGPITLEADTTIKAIAMKDGLADSPVEQFTYTVNKHMVTYNIGTVTSGTAPVDSQVYYKNDTVTVQELGNVVKSGYAFTGWSLNSDGSGTLYTAPATLTITTSDITFYATWAVLPMSLAGRELDEGTVDAAYSDTIAATGGSGLFTYSLTSGSLPSGLTLSDTGAITGTPTKTGSYSITVKAADANNGLTATAQFTMTVKNGGPVETLTSSPKAGGVEKGDLISLATITNGATIYYTTDGSNPTVSSTQYTAPFAINADTVVKAFAVKTGRTDSVVSTFSYTVNKHAVSYHIGTGTVGTAPTDSTVYYKGDSITVKELGNVQKAGYTFAGWSLNADGSGTLYTSDSPLTMDTSDIALYANWTKNPTFTVTYDGNGSTGGIVPADANSYENGKSATVLGNTGSLVKTGCSFVGWNTKADGSGLTYQAGDPLLISDNATLYAVWKANTYTIQFETNGGSAVDKHTAEYGSVIETTPETTRDGFYFGGWYSDKDLTNKITFPYTIQADATLYASWKQKETHTDTLQTKTTDGTNIIVTGDTGTVFDIGETLDVKTITISDDQLSAYNQKIAELQADASLQNAYSIKLLLDGKEVQPDGTITVKIQLTDAQKNLKNPGIAYIDDQGNIQLIPSQVEDGYIVFQTAHFSQYALIGESVSTINSVISAIVNPKTGDAASYLLLAVVAGTAILVQIFVVIRVKKQRRFQKAAHYKKSASKGNQIKS